MKSTTVEFEWRMSAKSKKLFTIEAKGQVSPQKIDHLSVRVFRATPKHLSGQEVHRIFFSDQEWAKICWAATKELEKKLAN